MPRLQFAAPLFGATALLATSTMCQAVPAVTSSAGLPSPVVGAATIGILFDRELDSASATTPVNYALNNGAGVQGAQLLTDGRTVVLTVDQLAVSSYNLTVNGVKDTANEPAVNLVTAVPVLNHRAAALQGETALNGVLQYATSANEINSHVAGGDSWTSDSMAYVWRELSGDFDVRVQCISAADAGNYNARMSLDVRNSLEPADAHLSIATFTGGRGYWGGWLRETPGGAASVLWFNYPSASGDWVVGYPPAGLDLPNNWLRVRRVGNVFTTFAGTNGLNWSRVGNHFIGSNLAPAVLVGLATASGDTALNMRAKYSLLTDYAYTDAQIGVATQPQSQTATQLDPVTFSVSAILTNGAVEDLIYEWRSNGVAVARGPWNTYSIASVPLSANGSTWTVSISAPGVAPVVGQGAILNVMEEATPPTVVSLAGLPGASAPATIGIRFNKLLDPVTATDPASYSLNNGATVQEAQLKADAKTVVLVVDQLSAAAYNLTINGVRDAALNPPLNTTVAVPLLALNAQTIEGSYFIASSMSFAMATDSFFAQVAGGDSWNPDSINFVYRPFAGDFDVRVQCLSVTNGGSGDARFSLDARDSADPTSRHVAIGTYPGRTYWGSWYRSGAGSPSVLWGTPVTGDWLVPYPPAGMNLPNNWIRLRRSGNVITTFASTNGSNWFQVGGHFTDANLPATMLVGTATAAGASDVMVAEYGNFGTYAYSDSSVVIGITAQPQGQAVTQLQPATLSVSAVLTNGLQADLIYEWRSNGVVVAKAPSASYTIAVTPLSANNSTWNVVISAPGVTPVTSANATLSVVANVDPPAVVSAAGLRAVTDPPTVGILFDKLLDPGSASNPANYTLDNGTAVQGAQVLLDGKTVVLTVDQLGGAPYSLTINGVRDAALNPPANVTFSLPVTDLTATTIIGNYFIGSSLSYAISTDLIGLQVTGGNSWDPDSVNYIYKPVTSDFDIRVQCVKAANGGQWDARLSLGVRDALDPASRHIAVGAFPLRGYWGSWVRRPDGTPSVLWSEYPAASGDWLVGFPPGGMNLPNNWLRIRRVGSSFTTFAGTNGIDWIQIGGTYTDPDAPAEMILGLESASGADAVTMAAEYNNLSQVVLRPTLTLQRVGLNLKVSWTGGTLQSAPDMASSFTDMGVTGNDYEFTPTEAQKFFRVRQ